ncbi:MAG: metal-dependent transcriptional regulator [Oscillospiraceae bacterium]|nr:metal-dependent transcriptional regulator [Oscillospiraceae bacterium]
MVLQESGEMYLETILVLSETGKSVRSIDVAEHMEFSKPSVSRAMSKLKEGGYILMDKSGYITLTETGKKIAETIYERHVVLSAFFKSIGVDPVTATNDACKIEHAISAESFEALKNFLEKVCQPTE